MDNKLAVSPQDRVLQAVRASRFASLESLSPRPNLTEELR